MNSDSRCGNPLCAQPSKLKCTGCSKISYCSSDCQKTHWSSHKATCKTSSSKAIVTVSSSSSAIAPSSGQQYNNIQSSSGNSSDEALRKLESIKSDTHKSFMAGDFPKSVQYGLEALALTKGLPPVIASQEACQLHLNLSTAYMQMQKFDRALEHTNQSVLEAELNMNQRAGQPQAVEVLSITLGTKAFTLVSADKADEALEPASRSLELAEKIYPKNDPRLHKALRVLATVKSKQDKFDEAEKLYLRSYTLLCIAPVAGPQCPEAQGVMDDLCNMLINRRHDCSAAEKYARSNYQALTDKKLDDRGEIVLSDAAARMSMIMRRQNKLPEAEQFLKQALAIREEKLVRLSPVGIAYTLVQLATIEELQGKCDGEVEQRLMKALEIFGRVKGQNSAEVQNTLNQLRALRSRRNGVDPGGAVSGGSHGAKGLDGDDDDADELQYTVTDESKHRINTLVTGDNLRFQKDTSSNRVDSSTDADGTISNNNSSNHHNSSTNSGSRVLSSPTVPSNSAKTISPHSGRTDEEEVRALRLRPGDSMTRLMRANEYFEQGRYSCADLLLSEAYQIVSEQSGPTDPTLKAIQGNLNISRQNRINQLWLQVVAELVMKQDERQGGSSSSPNSPTRSDDRSLSKDASLSQHSEADQSAIEQYAALMHGKGGIDELLFPPTAGSERPAGSQSVCSLC